MSILLYKPRGVEGVPRDNSTLSAGYPVRCEPVSAEQTQLQDEFFNFPPSSTQIAASEPYLYKKLWRCHGPFPDHYTSPTPLPMIKVKAWALSSCLAFPNIKSLPPSIRFEESAGSEVSLTLLILYQSSDALVQRFSNFGTWKIFNSSPSDYDSLVVE